MEKLLKYLKELEHKTNEEIDEIPEEFNDLEDSENYNYCVGVLETISKIRDFINAQKG